MSSEDRVFAAIETLYDAAIDEARWPDALHAIIELTGSQAATLWVLDSSGEPRLPTLITANFDPAFMKEYLEGGMVPLDPNVQYLVAHPDVPIFHDGMILSEREKDRLAYYDWHGRHSDTRFRMLGQIHPGPNLQAGVALHRTRREGSYDDHDLDRFTILYRHLQRALAIASRLGSLGAFEHFTTGLLDRSPASILLLDESRHVVYFNRNAAALDAANDGLRIFPSGFAARRKRDNDRLQFLISQALAGSAGASMRASRPSGKQPYVILVAPVSRRYSLLSSLRPAVCILITHPDQQPSLPADHLQTAFGLTQAEARLAVLLASGEELRSSAEKLGITYGTARVRLARIFEKTDTSRQGELIALILRTIA